jgi:hypothetical protein
MGGYHVELLGELVQLPHNMLEFIKDFTMLSSKSSPLLLLMSVRLSQRLNLSRNSVRAVAMPADSFFTHVLIRPMDNQIESVLFYAGQRLSQLLRFVR